MGGRNRDVVTLNKNARGIRLSSPGKLQGGRHPADKHPNVVRSPDDENVRFGVQGSRFARTTKLDQTDSEPDPRVRSCAVRSASAARPLAR